MDDLPAWVEVHRSPRRAECNEHALVLRAVGIPFRIENVPGGEFVLFVAARDHGRAIAELATYQDENVDWPPAKDDLPPIPKSATPSALVYAAVLIAAFVCERNGAFGLDWWTPGVAHAGSITGGEWWRAITALTLHTDFPHLAGNLVFGAVFGVLLAQLVGSGIAWSATTVAGVLGNLLNAWLRDAAGRSVGASTAVFGALGCLVAFEWRRRAELRVRPIRRWTPPLMGLVLLGWLGTGGERTDVLAHVTGMAAGCAIGALLGSRRARDPAGPRVQLVAGAAALLFLAAGWWLALGS